MYIFACGMQHEFAYHFSVYYSCASLLCPPCIPKARKAVLHSRPPTLTSPSFGEAHNPNSGSLDFRSLNCYWQRHVLACGKHAICVLEARVESRTEAEKRSRSGSKEAAHALGGGDPAGSDTSWARKGCTPGRFLCTTGDVVCVPEQLPDETGALQSRQPPRQACQGRRGLGALAGTWSSGHQASGHFHQYLDSSSATSSAPARNWRMKKPSSGVRSMDPSSGGTSPLKSLR